MIKFQISSTPAVFSKFFAPVDREATLAAIPADTKRVLFVTLNPPAVIVAPPDEGVASNSLKP